MIPLLLAYLGVTLSLFLGMAASASCNATEEERRKGCRLALAAPLWPIGPFLVIAWVFRNAELRKEKS